MSVEFSLFGRKLKYEGNIERYVEIQDKFLDIRALVMDKFTAEYDKLGVIENVINRAPALGLAAIHSLYLGFSDYYIELGMYGFNEQYLYKEISKEELFREFMSVIDNYRNNYSEIQYQQKREEARRELRKASRTTFSGMGFGVGNAISASLKAGMINMATGAAHSAFNAIGNASSATEARRARRAMYEKSADELLNAEIKCINKLFPIIIKQLGIKTSLNIAQGRLIYENIQKGVIKGDRVLDAAYQALECTPFIKGAYKIFLDKVEFQYQEDEIYKMADFFSVDLSQEKAETHDVLGCRFDDIAEAKIAKDFIIHLVEDLTEKYGKDAAINCFNDEYFCKTLNVEPLAYVHKILTETVKDAPSDTQFHAFVDVLATHIATTKEKAENLIKEKEAEEERKRIEAEKAAEKERKRQEEERKRKEAEAAKLAKEIERRKPYLKGFSTYDMAEFVLTHIKNCGDIYTGNQANSKYGKNIKNSYAKNKVHPDERILLVYDSTIFHSGDKGFAMTRNKILNSGDVCVDLNDIKEIDFQKDGHIVIHLKSKSSTGKTTVELFDMFCGYEETRDYLNLVFKSIFTPEQMPADLFKVFQSFAKEKQAENHDIQKQQNSNNATGKGNNKLHGLSTADLAQAIIYLDNKNLSSGYIAGNIPSSKAKNVCKSYGQNLNIAPEDLLFLMDCTIFGSAKDGYAMTKDYLFSSNGFCAKLDDIKCLELDGNKKLYAVMKKDNRKEEVWHLYPESTEPTAETTNIFYIINNCILNPDNMPENHLKKLMEIYKDKIGKQEVKNTSSIIVLDGSLKDRLVKIKAYASPLNFGDIHFGDSIPESIANAAISGYLGAYGINKNNIYMVLAKNGNGGNGLAISDTYILNDQGQGFALADIETMQVTPDGNFYVATNGQGYYLSDGINVPQNLEVLNQLLAAIFSKTPEKINL